MIWRRDREQSAERLVGNVEVTTAEGQSVEETLSETQRRTSSHELPLATPNRVADPQDVSVPAG
jgi:hypothetical protein